MAFRYKIGDTVYVRGGKAWTGKIRARKRQAVKGGSIRVLYEVSTPRGKQWFFTNELQKA